MKITESLSTKVASDKAQEVHLRISAGRGTTLRVKTGLFVYPQWMRTTKKVVNKTDGDGNKVASTVSTIVGADGRLLFATTKIDRDQQRRDAVKSDLSTIHGLLQDWYKEHKGAPTTLTTEAAQGVINAWHKARLNVQEASPADVVEKTLEDESAEPRLSVLPVFDEYVAHLVKEGRDVRQMHVLKNHLTRYERFRQLKTSTYILYVDGIDVDMLKDFESFLRIEHTFYDGDNARPEYAAVYVGMEYAKNGRKLIPQQRGVNVLHSIFKRLRRFVRWAIKSGYIQQSQYSFGDGLYEIPRERYGDVIPITSKERDLLRDFDLRKKPKLAEVRDTFVLQCLLGCRVGDLMKLTRANISVIDGILSASYVPGKTEREAPRAAVIPLRQDAISIIERYKHNARCKGHLTPVLCEQKYNEGLKELFKLAGLNRYVSVLNSVSGKVEQRHLNEIVSSHTARKTFISTAYEVVQDQALIASMSGHSENSAAFNRYRKIQARTKKNLLDQM